MLWSKHTSMMYTLPNCPCTQKTTWHYSVYLTEQVYETNIKVPLYIWPKCERNMEFKLVQIRVHFFLKKKSNKSFILSGLIEYHNNTEPPNGILPITVDKSNKVYVRKHEQYTDIVKHGCLKVPIYSVRWLFNPLYSKYNSKKHYVHPWLSAVNCNHDLIRKSYLLLFTLLKNPNFQHEAFIILKSFNCSKDS